MLVTLCVKLPSAFLLLPLAVDWHSDDMAIVTNNKKLLTSKEYET